MSVKKRKPPGPKPSGIPTKAVFMLLPTELVDWVDAQRGHRTQFIIKLIRDEKRRMEKL